MTKTIKTTLTIAILLGLLNVTYPYYTFIRFCFIVGLVLLSYKACKKQDKTSFIIYISQPALLIQPAFKMALD